MNGIDQTIRDDAAGRRFFSLPGGRPARLSGVIIRAWMGLAVLLLSGQWSRASGLRNQPLAGSSSGAASAQASAVWHLGKGFKYLQRAQYPEAIREYQTALKLDPHLTVRADLALGVAYFMLDDYDHARKQFEPLRAATGEAPIVMYYLGRIELMQANPKAAIRDLSKAAADPPFPDTDYYLAYAFVKKKQFATARQWLHKTEQQLTPGNFRIEEQVGTLYQWTGEAAESKRAMARAQAMREKEIETRNEWEKCAQALKTAPFAQARAICEKLNDPRDSEKLAKLGTLYGEHGHYEAALLPLRRAVELDPKSYGAQFDLGVTNFYLKRYPEAQVPLEHALKERPDVFEVNFVLGVVLYLRGADRDAFQALTHAHELNPANQDASYLLFKVNLSLAHKRFADKKYSQCLAFLQNAARLRPNDPAVSAAIQDVSKRVALESPSEAH